MKQPPTCASIISSIDPCKTPSWEWSQRGNKRGNITIVSNRAAIFPAKPLFELSRHVAVKP